MKLLYFIPALYNSGGMERVVTQKVNSLVRDFSHDITIVTTEQLGKPNFYPLADKIRVIHLDINFAEHLNCNLISKTRKHWAKQKKYRKKVEDIIDKYQPNICISTGGKEIEFLSKLKDKSIKMAELHFSKRFREHFLVSREKTFFWKYLGQIRTFQLVRSTQKLDKLIVLTKADAEDWNKTNNNVVQIYNPSVVQSEEVASVENKKALAVGRLDAQKGFDFLVCAWRLVVNKHPDWILDIWGSGEDYDSLQRQIADNHLEKNLFLRGVTDNVKNEYLNSSIYVMTSRYEGFPMVLIEAMSYGLPCVSFDCECGPKEIIAEEKNGFLVPVGDVVALADRIVTLIEDEKLRKAMSVSAKENSKRFDLATIMNQWNDLFQEFLK